MSIIAAYYYNEGKRVREIALDEHVKLGESRSGFCWIALSEPTPEELLAIQRTYNLHPLAIDNAMHPLWISSDMMMSQCIKRVLYMLQSKL